jgi:prepilin-type N-terminal cleavage/methylation domain-containing protein
MARQTQNRGFTLIELLVVISIIGVLSALLLANFVGVRERSADTKLKSDAQQLKKALRIYYNDYQNYPDNSGSNIKGCGAEGTSVCTAGEEFSAGASENIFMKEIPEGLIYYSDGDEYFLLRAELSNASDESIAESQTRCSREIQLENITADTTDYFVCQD